MSILAVRTFTDPILRKKVQSIETITPEINQVAKDMLETMYLSKGIGLAAPQVGLSKALIVIDISQDDESLNPLVFINPEIVTTKGKTEYEEGCLSIPGYQGIVERAEQVTLRYQNLQGERKSLPCKGLLARVIQHEMDHLKGILFTDYLDQEWWNSEEGKQMLEEHPQFSKETQFKKKKKATPKKDKVVTPKT
jgi:peptide deformylase